MIDFNALLKLREVIKLDIYNLEVEGPWMAGTAGNVAWVN